MTRYSQEFIDRCKGRWLDGRSFREIADELMPNVPGAYQTIFRWKDKYQWEVDREALDKKRRAVAQSKITGGLAELSAGHLVLADHILQAVELALQEYFILDEQGRYVKAKTDPRSGRPFLNGQTMAQLLLTATDMQRRALGVGEGIPRADLEEIAATETVEADPVLLKRFAEFLIDRPNDQAGTVAEVQDQASQGGEDQRFVGNTGQDRTDPHVEQEDLAIPNHRKPPLL